MRNRLLILDDEEPLVDALVRHFERRGYETQGVFTVRQATEAIEAAAAGAKPFAAVLSDLQLPDGDGRDVVKLVRKRLPDCPVVIMTGSRWVAGSVEAIRLGALTVLEKPVALDTLTAEIGQAIVATAGLHAGLDAASEAGIIGVSPQIRAALDVLLLVAPTDVTVLVEGETGTGKELAARAVHKLSRRARGPFVTVSCTAANEASLESELFGHAKGAFRGPDTGQKGRLRKAHAGTLFLDEIGDMPLAVQAKLLRVLQEGELRPIGAGKAHRVDVRVVAATSRNLDQEVEGGAFRGDLYYRLNVVPLVLPPLRDRREDIPVLAQHFLRSRSPSRELTPAALAALERYRWPGNARELENLIERLLVLKPKGDLDVADLPREIASDERAPLASMPTARIALPPEGVDLKGVLSDLEDKLIHSALERTHGNKLQAARVLGLNRTTLVEKLRKMSRKPDGT